MELHMNTSATAVAKNCAPNIVLTLVHFEQRSKLSVFISLPELGFRIIFNEIIPALAHFKQTFM